MAAEEADFSIKPQAITPNIPTSEWPLLLKNYDKCMSSGFPHDLICVSMAEQR
jgi:hypothetical protein